VRPHLVATVCAALAAAAIPGCGSRTGLDDPIGLGPGAAVVPGASSGGAGDAAAKIGGDASPASSGGSTSSGGSSSSGGSEGPPGQSEGGDLFTSNPVEPEGGPPGSTPPGTGPGGVPCSPSNCHGCCASDGTCQSGQVTSSCGNSGQACQECEAERSCNEFGLCV
jgi:hypothetical protein